MTTAEGVFPKINGDPLYASEANNFFAHKKVFKNVAQVLYNASYIGYSANLNGHAGTPNLWATAVGADPQHNFTGLGTVSLCVNNYNVFYLDYTTYSILYGGIVYDYMQGTSVNGTNWTSVGAQTATLTQVSNAYVQGTHSGGGDITVSAAALSIKPASANGEVILKFNASATHSIGSGSGEVDLYLRDESGHQVTLDSVVSPGGNPSITKTYRLVFTTNNCAVYDITSSYPGSGPSNVDTSTLSGTTWHLRGRAQNSTGGDDSQTVQIYPIVYVKGSAEGSAAKYLAVTNVVATTGNVNNLFLTWNGSTTNKPVTNFSADNGGHYTVITQDSYAAVGTDGTSFIIRFDFSGTNTELPKVYEYAGFYSLT